MTSSAACEYKSSVQVPLPTKEKLTDELYDADPHCKHEVKDAPGGGVKCAKCPGWFCF